MARTLVILKGDGIGPEVVDAALHVLDWVAQKGGYAVERQEALIGGAAIDRTGDPFPSETRALVDRADTVFLGAVGGPQWDRHPKNPESGLLALRAQMGLWANLRPFEVFEGMESFSPLARPNLRGMIIRELLGGLYFGQPRGRTVVNGEPEALETSRYTRHEIERVVRLGFQVAQRQGVPLVSVDKANVLETSKLWRQTVEEVRQDFPDVMVIHRYVDAAAMEFVKKPELYQVVVTENLFGDILSDLAGGLVGSLGLLGSATVNGLQGSRGLYEPVHGSAPDIQGQGIANPIGAILSVALMMEWSWGDREPAQWIRQAVRETLKEGYRTPDLGGQETTESFTGRVLQQMEQIHRKEAMSS